tara:strand:- start:68 stop:532 length:465 start_codon:yes stop_codon:yes gene_type:complete
MKHFEQAIANALHEAERAILQLVELEEPVWSNIFCIEGGKSNMPLSKGGKGKTGVYKIYHKDDLTTPVVIGEGNVGNRKGRHVTVMRNGGKSKTHENGSSSPCSTATKMYKYDSTLTNYFFQWCELPKSISSHYEAILIQQLKPVFNDQKMAGL